VDNERLISLAIEALERRKDAIQADIDALLAREGGRQRSTGRVAGSRSEKMKAYWAARKALSAKAPRPEKARRARRSGPQSPAARKAVSDRMKAYWAKRRAAKPATSGKNKPGKPSE
jgi:hypothetical protein